MQFNHVTPNINRVEVPSKASLSISKTKLGSLLSKTQRDEIVSKLGKESIVLVERKTKQTVILGLSLMLTSGVLYSLLATFVRWGSTLGYSAAEILVYRASIQMIVAAISYCISHRKLKKSFNNIPTQHVKDQVKKMLGRKQILAIIGRGIFGSGSTFTYFEGTTLIDVGDCVTLKALAAVFTSFAGYIILKEKISIKHMASLLFAMCACVLITQPPMIFTGVYSAGNKDNDFKENLPGYIISVCSSMFQAGVYICIKLAGNVPVVILIFSQGIFSCLLGVLVVIFWENSFHFFIGNVWQEYVCIFCVCSIGYGAQYTLTRGGQLLISGLASLMRATDIAWSFVWGIIFFTQYPNVLTIIGAIIMFLSVSFVSWEKIKKAAKYNQIGEYQNEYTVHTTDVWTVTIEDTELKDRKISLLNRDSFEKGVINYQVVYQDSYSALPEENEQFSDDENDDDDDGMGLTMSPNGI
eukprot:140889_1